MNKRIQYLSIICALALSQLLLFCTGSASRTDALKIKGYIGSIADVESMGKNILLLRIQGCDFCLSKVERPLEGLLLDGLCEFSIIYVGDTAESNKVNLYGPHIGVQKFYDLKSMIDRRPIEFGNFLLIEKIGDQYFSVGSEYTIIEELEKLRCE